MERRDAIGFSTAAAGHVLLLAALSFGLFKAPTIAPPKVKPIDVSLVDDSALESMTRKSGPASTAEAPEKGLVEDAAPAPAPAPQPEAAPAPKPQPAPPLPPKAEPKPQPKAEPKPHPRPVAEKPAPAPAPRPRPEPPRKVAAPAPETRKAPEKPKAEPAKSQAKAEAKPAQSSTPTKTASDLSKAMAGIAKSVEKPSAKSGSGTGETPRASRLGPGFLKGIADDTPGPPSAAAPAPLGDAEKRALNAEISRQLKPHWRAPTGADVDQLVTILRWRLNPDGTIASGPELVEQTGKTDTNRPQQQLHVEAAIRAVRAAAPFKLPPQYYAYWKNISSSRFDKRL